TTPANWEGTMRHDRFCSFWRRGVVLLTALATSFTASAQFIADDVFPDAPEKKWVLDTCMNCHDLAPVTQVGLSEEGWTQQIHKMIGDAAAEDQVKKAAAYLAKVLPPGHAFAPLSPTGFSNHARAQNGEVADYVPVTTDMLLHPPEEDWLMFSRTYDDQRFSP